jgi:signal transduction histidine kinase
VPLISPLGYLLGSYCVVHSDLKDYDNEETVGIMNDIAASIMVYLDGVRLKQSLNRSQDLIAGLTSFVSSDPLASVSQNTFPVPPTPTPSHPPVFDGPSSLNPPRRNASSSIMDSTDSAKQTRPALPNLTSGSSIESSISAPSLPGPGEALTPLTSWGDESSHGLAEQLAVGVHTSGPGRDGHAPSTPVSADPNVPEQHSDGFISSANIKSAFFRAAKTIQQGMGLDGLIFLDAAPTVYLDSDQHTVRDSRDVSEAAGPFCAAIIQSSADRESGSASPLLQTRLPEAVLQRLIKRFPGPSGHIFSGDELGPIDESYAPGKPFPGMEVDRSDGRLREDLAALFRVFPEAKYIVFLPLWHFQRECWYAATLGWVTDPTRAILPTDIGLLSAFGNSLMAEVSRLEAMAASQAKSSFVSSISHELRSPLHGILASSELLRGSISDPTLLSTLDMLDSCGRTLLDTFNNLLDHAITIKDELELSRRGSAVSTAKLEVVDLAELVQEVVDAVHFSFLSEKAFQLSLTGAHNGFYSGAFHSGGKSEPPLLIMLDIEKRDWRLPVDSGVWKRLIMNIFGNSLKYTKTGRIEVGLRMVQKSDSTGCQRNHICLRVEDTGKGMSNEFRKYLLFTPFAQEDHFAPGM